MVVRDDILERLRCPVTGSKLERASAEILALVNRQIATGTAQNRLSDVVETPVTGGLVNADRSLLFRIENGMLVMLAGEAIEIEIEDEAETA
jgi:uncharacterized protein YbaR (Trm112 family)